MQQEANIQDMSLNLEGLPWTTCLDLNMEHYHPGSRLPCMSFAGNFLQTWVLSNPDVVVQQSGHLPEENDEWTGFVLFLHA